jgi:hypothetical protein
MSCVRDKSFIPMAVSPATNHPQAAADSTRSAAALPPAPTDGRKGRERLNEVRR